VASGRNSIYERITTMSARKILVIDNYDSFVFNLVQYLAQLGAQCTVVRNDEIEVSEASNYDGVLISPGPGTPERAGVSVAMVHYCVFV
jgi:para-aminobenzoate synthetase component 2